jgi:5S rRNA maturation endonuclease (ribonuclease M5)
MGKIGVIVDGPGDYNSLRTRFTGNCRILKTDGPRGHTVSISDIVNSSRKQVSMLRDYACEKVVVLVDFEMRGDDYAEFVTNLRHTFTSHYIDCHVDVAVPNRMIENWYLADIEHLSRQKTFLKNNLRQKNYEGLNGKEELKKCFASGYSYSETTHGPRLFAILRFDVARQNSASFSDFLQRVDY